MKFNVYSLTNGDLIKSFTNENAAISFAESGDNMYYLPEFEEEDGSIIEDEDEDDFDDFGYHRYIWEDET